jgi:hypothetical protein
VIDDHHAATGVYARQHSVPIESPCLFYARDGQMRAKVSLLTSADDRLQPVPNRGRKR